MISYVNANEDDCWQRSAVSLARLRVANVGFAVRHMKNIESRGGTGLFWSFHGIFSARFEEESSQKNPFFLIEFYMFPECRRCYTTKQT